MNSLARIDVHTHLVPPFWGSALPSHGGDPSGWSLPKWTADDHLRYMDKQLIATSVLSLTAPSVVGWEGQARRDMARKVNEYTADLVAKYPTRFGNFATVPLPDVEGAVLEVEYALDVLKADGVVLLTNYEGIYLGDKKWAPLWAALNQRSAVVFIHPGHPIMDLLDGVPGPLVDYPFDTTRNAVHMVLNGVMDNYPNVKIILSHAGGFLPYAVMRFTLLAESLNPNGPSAQELSDKFKRFYFDTALSSGPNAFSSLLTFANHNNILFGSDYPYAPESVAAKFNYILDAETNLTDVQKANFNRNNGLALFPRLNK
ncbi:amidohydrolase family protein [Serratia ureilytica]|uniref:amidohydrolase family protein n=1 Tax=Serratia ureilytica TaxID=300181 RepID=UPI000B8ED034|nr:amidohydrolase family protein [Serratia ureilytica]MBU5411310.1 amidohydrolase [Serratia ureilytica]MEB5993344.1 amidohydrolase [Serratia ureilytica]